MSTALNRPNLIARVVMLLAIALAVVVVIVVAGGGKNYVLKLQMANASGIRPGSQVLLGGVAVGTVGDINFDPGINGVVAQLNLDPTKVHIGRGVSTSIVAANLLGEEYVAINPGNPSLPLRSGTVLPESATTVPTDLDQIVNVLNAPTRARLAILLQEAGVAVNGRQSDVSAILRQFPLSLTAATKLLTTMVQDNHTLADLVANSNGFISRVNQQSSALRQVIGASAGAMQTLSADAHNLALTVQGADSVVRTFTKFFIQSAPIVDNLIPVANEITNAAPKLTDLLTAVKPFTAAAVPTLNQAAAVAPQLTRLAEQATPTLTQAVPTVSALERTATLARPLSSWLGLSAQDLIAIIANWSKAVQYRDGIGHVFGGEIYLDPQIVLGIANKGATAAQRCQNLLDVKNNGLLNAIGDLTQALHLRQTGCNTTATTPASTPKKTATVVGSKPTAPVHTSPVTSHPASPLAGLGSTLSGVISKTPVVSGVGKVVGGLLGGLSGALSGHGTAGATGATGTTAAQSSGSGAAVANGLKGLVHYLLGN
jgi:phospholipid/cholesterol/gamma-HCH transport system substrate-binding protein